jgi:hypothetical protein
MLYKINEIGDEGLSLKVPLSADWLTAECPDLGAKMAPEGLVFKGHLSRSGEDLLLNGTLSGGLECVCARCLETARLSLRLPVHVVFVAREEDDDDDEDDAKATDNLDVGYFDGDQLDLGPAAGRALRREHRPRRRATGGRRRRERLMARSASTRSASK